MMKATLLVATLLGACANPSRDDYDARLKCLSTMAVMSHALQVSGYKTERSQADERRIMGDIATGAIAAGRTLGKTDAELDGEFKAAKLARSRTLGGLSDEAARKALTDLGNETIACVDTYKRRA